MNFHVIGLIGACVVLILCGPIFIGKGGYELYRTLDTQSWPTTQGVVLHSDVRSKQIRRIGKPSSTSYTFVVSYEYTVKDETFNSGRVSYGSVNKNSSAYVHNQLAKYPAGQAVEVHYNPHAPGESVLETQITFWTWINLAVGVIGPLLGIPLLRWTIKTVRENKAKTAGL